MNPYEHQSGMGYGYPQPGERQRHDRPYDRYDEGNRRYGQQWSGGEQDWRRADNPYHAYDAQRRGIGSAFGPQSSGSFQQERPDRPGYDPREYDRSLYQDRGIDGASRSGGSYAYPSQQRYDEYDSWRERDRSSEQMPMPRQRGYDSYGSMRSQGSGYSGYPGERSSFGQRDDNSGYGYGNRSGSGSGYGYGSGYSGYSGSSQGRGSYWDSEEGYGSSGRRRGKAPKNYKRTDDRLMELVSDRLMDSGCDCSEIEVNVKDGIVTLTGEVEDRREKHRFERLAADIGGVEDVENRLSVNRSKGDTQWESKSGTGRSGSSGTYQQGAGKGASASSTTKSSLAH